MELHCLEKKCNKTLSNLWDVVKMDFRGKFIILKYFSKKMESWGLRTLVTSADLGEGGSVQSWCMFLSSQSEREQCRTLALQCLYSGLALTTQHWLLPVGSLAM